MRYFFIVIVVFCSTLAYSADSSTHQSPLHDRIIAIYSFSPRNLDKAAQEKKSKEMDVFWEEVKHSGPSGIADLRMELARSDLPAFFNYDGAMLLLSLSKSRDDRTLALSSITRADLRDLQWKAYFDTVHWLAADGLDTWDAAVKILGEDKYQVIIPQHALTLNQELCLLYLLMPTDESFYIEKAQKQLFEEKSVTAQKSILTLLGYSVTLGADAAIARFASDPKQSDEARNYAKQIISATNSMGCGSIIGLSFSSYESLKEEQRKLFRRVSDEALYDIRRVQLKLRCKGAK